MFFFKLTQKTAADAVGILNGIIALMTAQAKEKDATIARQQQTITALRAENVTQQEQYRQLQAYLANYNSLQCQKGTDHLRAVEAKLIASGMHSMVAISGGQSTNRPQVVEIREEAIRLQNNAVNQLTSGMRCQQQQQQQPSTQPSNPPMAQQQQACTQALPQTKASMADMQQQMHTGQDDDLASLSLPKHVTLDLMQSDEDSDMGGKTDNISHPKSSHAKSKSKPKSKAQPKHVNNKNKNNKKKRRRKKKAVVDVVVVVTPEDRVREKQMVLMRDRETRFMGIDGNELRYCEWMETYIVIKARADIRHESNASNASTTANSSTTSSTRKKKPVPPKWDPIWYFPYTTVSNCSGMDELVKFDADGHIMYSQRMQDMDRLMLDDITWDPTSLFLSGPLKYDWLNKKTSATGGESPMLELDAPLHGILPLGLVSYEVFMEVLYCIGWTGKISLNVIKGNFATATGNMLTMPQVKLIQAMIHLLYDGLSMRDTNTPPRISMHKSRWAWTGHDLTAEQIPEEWRQWLRSLMGNKNINNWQFHLAVLLQNAMVDEMKAASEKLKGNDGLKREWRRQQYAHTRDEASKTDKHKANTQRRRRKAKNQDPLYVPDFDDDDENSHENIMDANVFVEPVTRSKYAVHGGETTRTKMVGSPSGSHVGSSDNGNELDPAEDQKQLETDTIGGDHGQFTGPFPSPVLSSASSDQDSRRGSDNEMGSKEAQSDNVMAHAASGKGHLTKKGKRERDTEIDSDGAIGVRHAKRRRMAVTTAVDAMKNKPITHHPLQQQKKKNTHRNKLHHSSNKRHAKRKSDMDEASDSIYDKSCNENRIPKDKMKAREMGKRLSIMDKSHSLRATYDTDVSQVQKARSMPKSKSKSKPQPQAQRNVSKGRRSKHKDNDPKPTYIAQGERKPCYDVDFAPMALTDEYHRTVHEKLNKLQQFTRYKTTAFILRPKYRGLDETGLCEISEVQEASLEKDKWLKDEIVSFGMTMITLRSHYTYLTNDYYLSHVSKTKVFKDKRLEWQIGLFKRILKTVIFITVLLNRNHWVLVEVRMEDGLKKAAIKFYEDLPRWKHMCQPIAAWLIAGRKLILSEHEKDVPDMVVTIDKVQVGKMMKPSNKNQIGHCGLFALMHAVRIVSGSSALIEPDMPRKMRIHMKNMLAVMKLKQASEMQRLSGQHRSLSPAPVQGNRDRDEKSMDGNSNGHENSMDGNRKGDVNSMDGNNNGDVNSIDGNNNNLYVNSLDGYSPGDGKSNSNSQDGKSFGGNGTGDGNSKEDVKSNPDGDKDGSIDLEILHLFDNNNTYNT